jgi:hypothetical protein
VQAPRTAGLTGADGNLKETCVTRRLSRAVSTLLMLIIVAGPATGSSISMQAKPAPLGITLTNAYDAFGQQRKGLTQDFGFSCVVRYRGKMILFDSGTDARIFEHNIKALKIDCGRSISPSCRMGTMTTSAASTPC